MKAYKLLKDLPDIDAGSIIELHMGNNFHEIYVNEDVPKRYQYDFILEILDNKKWFEEITK